MMKQAAAFVNDLINQTNTTITTNTPPIPCFDNSLHDHHL